MRIIMTALVFMLGMNQAHALRCALTVGPNEPVFNDEVLSDGSKQQVILVKPDGTMLPNFNFKSLNTAEKLKEFNQSVFAMVAVQQENLLVISLGSIDLSKKENVFPMEAAAAGLAGKLLSVQSYAKNAFFTCFEF